MHVLFVVPFAVLKHYLIYPGPTLDQRMAFWRLTRYYF